jgi:16S rRNA (uracil1498-N3)-methyltransferase
MQIFYANNADIQQGKLNEEESAHCVRVLRKNIGDKITVTNGLGLIVHATIHQTDKKNAYFTVDESVVDTAKIPDIHIAMAPPKNIDRFMWFVEKAVEIGIKEITPIYTDRSERKKVNSEKLQKFVVAACKQSATFTFPIVHQECSFNEFIHKYKDYNLLIGHCSDTFSKLPLHEVLNTVQPIFLIGPEGDFSEREIEKVYQINGKGVHLTHKRLRTETAGVFVVNSFFNAQNL